MVHTVATALGTGLCALLLSGACAGSGGPATPTESPVATSTPVDPRSLLEASVAALQGQRSFHFELDDASQATLVLPGLLLLQAQGDVADPDHIQVLLGLQSPDVTAYLEMEMRIIEDRAYVRDPLSGTWGEVDARLLPVNFVDLGGSLGQLLRDLESPSYEGLLQERGRSRHRVSGTIPAWSFGILFYTVAREGTTAIEVLIDVETLLPHQIVIRGRLLETDAADARRTLRLSEFGKKVSVTPP